MSDEKTPRETVAEKHDRLIGVRDAAVEYAETLYGGDSDLSYSYLTGGWTLKGETYARDKVLTLLSGQMPAVSERLVKYALLRLEMKRTQEHLTRRRLAAMRVGASGGQEDDSALRDWYWALTGKRGDGIEVAADLAALKQVMWQILRSASDKSLSWQIVCVLWSAKQGSGKTFMLDRLLEPWKEDTLQLRAYQLAQDFFAPVIARSLVMVLDEFAGPGEGEERLGNWKSYLTAGKVMRRRMYEDTCFEAPNRTTALATSNLPPPHQIKDSSGGRRQWSIQAKEESILDDPQRAEVARALDMGKVWKAVSADTECFHDTLSLELRQFMAGTRDSCWRQRGPVEAWYTSCTAEAPGQDLLMDKQWRFALNRFAADNRLGDVRGEAKDIAVQLQALGAETAGPGGRYRILNRRSTTDDLHSPTLRIVKKQA